jgi:hypothetical protein
MFDCPPANVHYVSCNCMVSPEAARSQSVVTGTRPVYEGHGCVIANSFPMRVQPDLRCVRPLLSTRVRFHLVRRAVNDVQMAAVGPPARPVRRCGKRLFAYAMRR